jgi:ribonuclease P protein component
LDIFKIRKRADFLSNGSSNVKVVTKAFVLIISDTKTFEYTQPGLRFGITVSKKIGNSVKRNRAKRRLRTLAKHVLSQYGLPYKDYVLIARAYIMTRKFEYMANEFISALKTVSSC